MKPAPTLNQNTAPAPKPKPLSLTYALQTDSEEIALHHFERGWPVAEEVKDIEVNANTLIFGNSSEDLAAIVLLTVFGTLQGWLQEALSETDAAKQRGLVQQAEAYASQYLWACFRQSTQGQNALAVALSLALHRQIKTTWHDCTDAATKGTTPYPVVGAFNDDAQVFALRIVNEEQAA